MLTLRDWLFLFSLLLSILCVNVVNIVSFQLIFMNKSHLTWWQNGPANLWALLKPRPLRCLVINRCPKSLPQMHCSSGPRKRWRGSSSGTSCHQLVVLGITHKEDTDSQFPYCIAVLRLHLDSSYSGTDCHGDSLSHLYNPSDIH